MKCGSKKEMKSMKGSKPMMGDKMAKMKAAKKKKK